MSGITVVLALPVETYVVSWPKAEYVSKTHTHYYLSSPSSQVRTFVLLLSFLLFLFLSRREWRSSDEQVFDFWANEPLLETASGVISSCIKAKNQKAGFSQGLQIPPLNKKHSSTKQHNFVDLSILPHQLLAIFPFLFFGEGTKMFSMFGLCCANNIAAHRKTVCPAWSSQSVVKDRRCKRTKFVTEELKPWSTLFLWWCGTTHLAKQK